MNTNTVSLNFCVKQAKSHYGGFGYLTIVTLLFSCSSIILLQYLFATDQISLWLHFLLSAYLFYMIYTPLHEAVHGNISGKHQSLKWVNPVVGVISAIFLLFSYTEHKWDHLLHHKYTNDQKLDPDYFVKADNPFSVIIRCLLILLKNVPYAIRNWNHPDINTKRNVIQGILENLIPIAILVVITNMTTLPWYFFLISYVFPLLMGTFLLGLFFDYFVHIPHDNQERFGNTNVIRFSPKLDRVITWIWLWQNYHAIHHLFPAIPFYNYKKVFNKSEKELRELDLPVFDIVVTDL